MAPEAPLKPALVLGAAYLAVALGIAAPLLPHLASAFPHDSGDPLLNTWLLWWNTQHLPLTAAWWNAPMFYPAPDVMALSEVLLGLMPITAPVQWLTGSPVVAYNVAFLLTFPLCGMAAALLAYVLTGRRDAAAVAGLAFAFAPYRMGQLAHLQMLAYYGAPLALAGLQLYDRTHRRRWLALFGGAWLMQALTNGYALFHLSVLVGLWIVWFVRTRRALIEIAAAWALALVPVAPLLLKYQQVHDRWHLTRDINEIRRFSVDLADFLRAPSELVVWGERMWVGRPETTVFPGATVCAILAVWMWVEWRAARYDARTGPAIEERVLLYVSMAAGVIAVSALTIGPWRLGPLSVSDFHKPFSIAVYARLLAWVRGRSMRDGWQARSVVMFYLVAGIAMYGLALGPEPRLLGRPLLYEPPYAWLMRLPGFASLRVPGRFAMLAVLCQSMLLSMAVARFAIGRWQRVLPVALALGILADGWVRLPVAPAPPPGPTVDAAASAVVELPVGDSAVDFVALYHQMQHRRPLMNGYSGYNPPHYLPLSDAVRAGQVEVLTEIAQTGSIEVAIDRGRADSPALTALVSAVAGARALPTEPRWVRFVVPQTRRTLPPSGAILQVALLSANVGSQDTPRMLDGDIETAWHGGRDQIGHEEVTVDLGVSQEVGAVVMEMGPLAFGHPRELAIDIENPRGEFVEAFRGPTAAFALRAALEDSQRVPISIPLGRVTTRRLRLRQLGSAAGIPWWIAELSVRAPDATQ